MRLETLKTGLAVASAGALLAVAVSMTEPVSAVWWLRPVLRAIRVGEHKAVVWKLL